MKLLVASKLRYRTHDRVDSASPAISASRGSGDHGWRWPVNSTTLADALAARLPERSAPARQANRLSWQQISIAETPPATATTHKSTSSSSCGHPGTSLGCGGIGHQNHQKRAKSAASNGGGGEKSSCLEIIFGA